MYNQLNPQSFATTVHFWPGLLLTDRLISSDEIVVNDSEEETDTLTEKIVEGKKRESNLNPFQWNFKRERFVVVRI